MPCARKINDEWNFLQGIHTNPMFFAIILFIVGLQIFVIESWRIDTTISLAFSVHKLGLTGTQWIISLVLSMATLIINAMLKVFPEDYCIPMGGEPQEEKDIAKKEYDELIEIANRYKYRTSSKVKESSL